MNRNNLLPLLRRWRVWLVLALSVTVLFVSCALLARAVKNGAAEISRAYESLTIRFSLSGGRDTLSSGASVGLHQIRKLQETRYFSSIECDDISASAMTASSDPVTIWQTFAPTSVAVLEGERTEGYWLTQDVADRLGVSLGDEINVCPYNMTTMEPLLDYGSSYPVTAIIEGGSRFYVPDDVFDKVSGVTGGGRRYYFNSFRFTLRRTHNEKLDSILRELQRIFNGPTSYEWNKYITVDYNAAEVDGMIKPLVKSQASAAFFERIFRRLLPLAVYALEVFSLLGFTNEIGVRRMLGERFAGVFLGIFLPVLVLSLPGYGLAAGLLALLGLTGDVSWTLFFLHLAGTAVLTAALLAALTAAPPLLLLRSREDG